jgi:phosphatidylinositol glycan class S
MAAVVCYLLQVAKALSDISSAWQHTTAGNYTAAAAAARTAHAAAEAAFSHPAVLTQLNFPESHKLGVYMPLFLPLCVPLLQGLMGQLVYYSKQRRRYLLQAGATAG